MEPRQPHVDHFYFAVRRDEHVRRLDVAMDDVALMSMMQRFRHFVQPGSPLWSAARRAYYWVKR